MTGFKTSLAIQVMKIIKQNRVSSIGIIL